MLDALMSIWNFLAGLWRTLPESKREEIKEMMTDRMEDIFRRYYSDAKEKAGAA